MTPCEGNLPVTGVSNAEKLPFDYVIMNWVDTAASGVLAYYVTKSSATRIHPQHLNL